MRNLDILIEQVDEVLSEDDDERDMMDLLTTGLQFGGEADGLAESIDGPGVEGIGMGGLDTEGMGMKDLSSLHVDMLGAVPDELDEALDAVNPGPGSSRCKKDEL